ncbi:uncharacterized protein CLUP02_18326 [Colletotrichum lupini]|uniref:Uncharacterized protein n=1 Tax=Colletotrichum lupini TaxID=145971 RepID=A0A9Q8SH50_9PEZI|nr:uncharacterized protein CLUP02_18326 [Colletotrichum lupini]UQC76811.1 hypothetical protein CLUP02_18326 [Colletotrichum lupini]
MARTLKPSVEVNLKHGSVSRRLEQHRETRGGAWDDKTIATSEAGHWTVSVDMRYEGGWGLEVEASQTDRQEAAQSKSHLRCWSRLPERETWKRPENPPAHIQILGVLLGLDGLGLLRLVALVWICGEGLAMWRMREDVSMCCRVASSTLEAQGGETLRDDVWDHWDWRSWRRMAVLCLEVDLSDDLVVSKSGFRCRGRTRRDNQSSDWFKSQKLDAAFLREDLESPGQRDSRCATVELLRICIASALKQASRVSESRLGNAGPRLGVRKCGRCPGRVYGEKFFSLVTEDMPWLAVIVVLRLISWRRMHLKAGSPLHIRGHRFWSVRVPPAGDHPRCASAICTRVVRIEGLPVGTMVRLSVSMDQGGVYGEQKTLW